MNSATRHESASFAKPNGEPRQGHHIRLAAQPPRGLVVNDSHGELTITRRWFTWAHLGLACFAFFWNGFLAFWYLITFVEDLEKARWLFRIIPIIHVGVGFHMTYLALAGFLNTTTLKISQGRLTVRHGPLPWRCNHDLLTTNLKFVYCHQKKMDDEGSMIRYEVRAATHDWHNITLLPENYREDHARYVIQAIEVYRDW